MSNPAKTHFPLAEPGRAEEQMQRLQEAKQYLADRGIAVTARNSKFEYVSGPCVLRARLLNMGPNV